MATKKKAQPVEQDDDDDERPAKKKKKKKQSAGNPALLYIIIGTVVALLVVAGGGTAAFFFFKRPANPPVVAQDPAKGGDEKDDRSPQRIVVPGIKEGNPAKKGGVVNNVRGAVYRTERRSELSNINKMHTAWSLDAGPKTQEGYLQYIKRDFGPVHDAIKEGYYRVNVKAKSGSNDILAGERDADTNGQHLAVRANGSVDYVPVDEWKRAMGIP